MKAGSRLVEDVNTLGDVAVAGAADWVAGRISGNEWIGLGIGLATWWALRQREGAG